MSKKYTLLMAIICGLVFFFSMPLSNFAEKKNKKNPQYGGTLRVKSFTNILKTSLDPANPESYIFVLEQIYDGLVRLDKDFNIVPRLAEYWKISPDGKKYVFYLRKGIKFHHGRELTAEDVKFSLERLVNSETNSPYYQFFTPRVVGAQDYRTGKTRHVEGFKVRNKHIFEIQLIRPYVSALYLMSMNFCKVLPRDLVLSQGKGFFSKPSGTGPFKFTYWMRSPQLEIVGFHLERNDQYFRGKPYLDAVEFSPYFRLDHFMDKEIDIIPVLSDRLFRTDCQIFEGGFYNLIFLGMSCHIPPLDRNTVRKAIFSGVNKSDVARVAFDSMSIPKIIKNYIPPVLPGFFPIEEEESYDLKQAKEILQDEGFSEEKKFPSPTLFLDYPRTEIKFKIHRELRRQLDVLGIRLRLKYYSSLEEIKRFKEPYLIFFNRSMSFPDPEDIIRPLFFSKSIFNVFRFANPALDELLERAETERSWTKRIKLFHQIENILFADVPAIPLFSNQQRIAVQPYVKGVELPPLGFYYLEAKNIWLDK